MFHISNTDGAVFVIWNIRKAHLDAAMWKHGRSAKLLEEKETLSILVDKRAWRILKIARWQGMLCCLIRILV